MRAVDVLICGAGPTGLGAAWRLEEYRRAGLGTLDWMLVDANTGPGGMATSEHSDGFVWDLGGHVLFPHYDYFDELLDELVDEWHSVVPVRGAWMWDRFIPYPVQRNLRHFPDEPLTRAVEGLRGAPEQSDPQNLEEFLIAQFGVGLYADFFVPLNTKMWATHPRNMGFEWADQRSGSASTNVPRVDVDEVIADIEAGRDATAWTSDSAIRYPATGGTGSIWQQLTARLPGDRVEFGCELIAIDTGARCAHFRDGRRVEYEYLVSSMPLDRLLRLVVDQPQLDDVVDRIRPAATHSVGIGLRGEPPAELADICSLYIPDPEIPFWRVTVLSNYSPGNAPPGHWSLLCEINASDERPFADDDPIGLVATALDGLGFTDRRDIVSTWERRLSHGYPVPHPGRDADLALVHGVLEPFGVFSRGRFGGWRYEVSNQDHAFMQGLEVIDRLVDGRPEVTYPTPTAVNSSSGRGARRRLAPD